MKSLLRQHRYALIVTLRRLLAQPISSLTNLLVIALALTLPLLGATFLISIEPVARQVSVTPELTLFLKTDAANDVANKLEKKIREEHVGQIINVRVIPKQRALEELRANPAWEQALKVLPVNPLPDALVVELAPGDDLAKRADQMAAHWRTWQGVDHVQLDSAWVQRLEALLRFGRIGLLLLALSVMLVVLATVFNTVRMQALSQREEIGVARLVGATESFVRRPFLYLGALTCTLAALISLGIARLTLAPLNDALASLARTYDAEFALKLPDTTALIVSVLIVAALGALSARWSVQRSTRF
ncbi:MAG: ABC transporter permease [Burkholderiaceae bacterium]|jgi:cell division transport system permease protein|nr:ABC transporter permease [Burkholderiaceae bacterium]MDP4968926.1 ABC transporter permease [Burkholderiaceae bacterium]MDP5110969.1 ABC transporter permease [Burkholderiaceae bacterium]